MIRFHSLGGFILLTASSAFPAAILFNNDTPTNSIGIASRPGIAEIEAADDFVFGTDSSITSATFTGLISGGLMTSNINQVVVEIYRVFPLDSNNPPSGHVPTRANSPSDVAFASRDSSAAELSFSANVLAATFTANNSVLNGIHPLPNQTTGGEQAVTGQEVRFAVNFTTPIVLPAGHYFFVPQVGLNSSNGNFFWLSASRPISGSGTTPFAPDLQAWIRNAALDPDWLRVGTDIVGGSTPPTFNAAFSLTGDAAPEPSTLLFAGFGLILLGARRRVLRAAGSQNGL